MVSELWKVVISFRLVIFIVLLRDAITVIMIIMEMTIFKKMKKSEMKFLRFNFGSILVRCARGNRKTYYLFREIERC
jgi:hypothetical protein